MGLKDLFWKSGDSEDVPESLLRDGSSRPVATQAVNPLEVLRSGPTASIFARTSGLSSVITSPVATPAVRASVDHEFDTVITDALGQDAKAPGYREFMAQLNALSNIIPDKGQCVRAALAAVTAINPSFNATVVARAIGERLKLLTSYQESYDSESQKSEENDTSDKRSAIGEIETRLRDIDTEIQRLAGERAQCESQMKKINGELQGTGTKYDGYRARFNGTIQAHREELKNLLRAVAPGATEEEK